MEQLLNKKIDIYFSHLLTNRYNYRESHIHKIHNLIDNIINSTNNIVNLCEIIDNHCYCISNLNYNQIQSCNLNAFRHQNWRFPAS